MVEPQVERDRLRRDCWDGALHAFGTSSIFQERARRLKRNLQVLTYSGIGLPLVVGATALSYDLDAPILLPLIPTVALLLIAQLAVSAWSLVAGWVDSHAYATDSMIANEALANKFEELAKNPPPDEQFKVQYDLRRADDRNRRQLDLRQHIDAKERRQGMRAALRQYQRRCATCQQIPVSLKPTSCDTCGNF